MRFGNIDLRCVEIDGEPWFVANDVCEVLGLSIPTNAVRPLVATATLYTDEKRKSDLPLGPGSRPTLVSESGLYKLIMRSDKPETKDFQHWVTAVVLLAFGVDCVMLNDLCDRPALQSECVAPE